MVAVVVRFVFDCVVVPRSQVMEARGVFIADWGTSTAPGLRRRQQNADAQADHVGKVLTAISKPFNASMLRRGFLVDGIWSIIWVLTSSLNCILYMTPYDVMHLSNVAPV